MTKTTPKKSPGCLFPILFLILVIAGLSLFILIPQNAEKEFGQADKGLSLVQRMKTSLDLVSHAQDLKLPAQENGAEVDFTIEPGDPPADIANRLEAAGIIRDADLFTTYLIYSGMDKGIQSGTYQLNPAQNALQIASRIQNSTPDNATLVILPGWRMEEIAASIPTSGFSFSPQDFLQLAQNPDGLNSMPVGKPDGASLEGYLFPERYEIQREAPAQTVLETIINRFNDQMSPELKKGFRKNGLSVWEAVILASIVQKEAVHEDEQPIIASVFLNRISAGMKLESDPTVQYAIGFDPGEGTWWKNPLTAEDLQVDSPYNTYLYGGLPPGPISEPGLSALQAVSSPAQTTYYYFRSRCDGSGYHAFAETYSEHINNACP